MGPNEPQQNILNVNINVTLLGSFAPMAASQAHGALPHTNTASAVEQMWHTWPSSI